MNQETKQEIENVIRLIGFNNVTVGYSPSYREEDGALKRGCFVEYFTGDSWDTKTRLYADSYNELLNVVNERLDYLVGCAKEDVKFWTGGGKIKSHSDGFIVWQEGRFHRIFSTLSEALETCKYMKEYNDGLPAGIQPITIDSPLLALN